jgi:hypothetical protein
MLVQEYLMVCLMEELSEMQHAASKCLRFGPFHVCKEHGIENIQKVQNELEDVFGTLSLLGAVGVEIKADQSKAQARVDKLMEQINKAIEAGIITGIEEPAEEGKPTLIIS